MKELSGFNLKKKEDILRLCQELSFYKKKYIKGIELYF